MYIYIYMERERERETTPPVIIVNKAVSELLHVRTEYRHAER